MCRDFCRKCVRRFGGDEWIEQAEAGNGARTKESKEETRHQPQRKDRQNESRSEETNEDYGEEEGGENDNANRRDPFPIDLVARRYLLSPGGPCIQLLLEERRRIRECEKQTRGADNQGNRRGDPKRRPTRAGQTGPGAFPIGGCGKDCEGDDDRDGRYAEGKERR